MLRHKHFCIDFWPARTKSRSAVAEQVWVPLHPWQGDDALRDAVPTAQLPVVA